jgi:hypothetical protein
MLLLLAIATFAAAAATAYGQLGSSEDDRVVSEGVQEVELGSY